MVTMSLRMPSVLDARVTAAARRRRLTKSALVREALEAYVARADVPTEGSVLDLARDLVGCVQGPGDLSHNPKRMRGYGR
jgi:hypothetical protein